MEVDEVWDWLNTKIEKDWMVTAGSPYGDGSDKLTNSLGVAFMHAYTVLGTETLSNGQRLVRMRNPWGEERYEGPYYDYKYDWKAGQVYESNYWTQSLKDELDYVQADDGMWYIRIEDFVWSFSDSTANPNIDDWHQAHYAAFEVETPDVHYETITISSEVRQMVYISAYSYDS